MKKSVSSDLLCDTSCKSFRCSERMLRIIRKTDQKRILCRMVEGDECVGYKCKFAFCSYRPPSLDLTTGVCAQKKKKNQGFSRKQPKAANEDDPLKYREKLNKKMKKNFQLKDFY
ncbi:MAG: hypothetical protein ACFFAU_03655 [Candidatus Hodarchaeota archaeon]